MNGTSPKEAAALIVHIEAQSKFNGKPIEDVMEPLMDHCHEHWMGAQAFHGPDEEFTLFTTVLQLLYQDDTEIIVKLREELSVLKILSAMFSGVPVDPIALEGAEEKIHYKLMNKWREKFL